MNRASQQTALCVCVLELQQTSEKHIAKQSYLMVHLVTDADVHQPIC